jgi:hypothetical protein
MVSSHKAGNPSPSFLTGSQPIRCADIAVDSLRNDTSRRRWRGEYRDTASPGRGGRGKGAHRISATLTGLLWFLLALAPPALAVEFRPFAEAEVTVEQWQDYYDQVEQSFCGTKRRFPEQKLVTMEPQS